MSAARPGLAAIWPLAGLSLRTERLQLVYPDEARLVELAGLAEEGIYEPGANPFRIAWAEPAPDRERRSLQWWWSQRANWSPERWSLSLAVIFEGRTVGVQDLMAQNFAQLRSVSTGSWLVRAAQGRGVGTEMREAVLALAFEGLGAEEAHSRAFAMNPASIAVSHHLGYEDNGEEPAMRGDVPERVLCFRLSREGFAEHRRNSVEIRGLAGCREMFGSGEAS